MRTSCLRQSLLLLLASFALACGPNVVSDAGIDAVTDSNATGDSQSTTDTPTVDATASDVFVCAAPRLICGSACIDPTTDDSNCGRCGNACATGTTCSNGACMQGCVGTTHAMCGTSARCVDLSTDPHNCGRCDNLCAGGTVCQGGICTCPIGASFCAGQCVDTQSDPNNCGACGHACAAGTQCFLGTCGCANGSRCAGRCVNTQTDNLNCGTCGNICGGATTCHAGACMLTSIAPSATSNLDVLFLIDNSNSMRDNQSQILGQFGGMVDALIHPPCVNAANTTPHTCDAMNPADRPQFPPVASLHLGVISSDLGTPGSQVPGCANSDTGDDGVLNPIRNGAALMQHEPATTAPPTFPRPMDCTDPNEFPSFITFQSTPSTSCMPDTACTTVASNFIHHSRCNAGLYSGGCGLEQQLEAVWRALVWHDPRARAGNTDANAGFVRDDAVLAVILLTDEDDASARDCRYAAGGPCTDGTDVFNSRSTTWGSLNLNLRDYLYRPGGAQDPTWPLDRYMDPTNPTRGYLSLKPGHPERLIFAAIGGVPLSIPTIGSGISAHPDWDALLGTPDPTNPDLFTSRDSSTAIDMMSAEGPISMRQANPDPNCPERVVPGCRRQGTTYSTTACTTDVQYFAWPARRIVEIARRFDQAPLCGGAPCHNGYVSSICANDYSAAMGQVVQHIGWRLVGN